MNRVTSIRKRRSLPHWETRGGAYFVTFRLCDSLPQNVIDRIASLPKPQRFPDGSLREAAQQARLDFIDDHLDAGLGNRWLERAETAAMMTETLLHFDGQRYELCAWCVMPNHVHVLVRASEPFALSQIVHSWKSFSAHRANDLLGRSGELWQREYFDHLIRDANDFQRVRRYIEQNPARAGLKNWRWVSA